MSGENRGQASIKRTDVQVYDRVDNETFSQIQKCGRPAIMKSCDYGPCMRSWTLDYLAGKLDSTEVIVHESSSKELDFLEKNFVYRKCSFAEFARLVETADENRHANSVYLRSVASNQNCKNPAKITADFPQIGLDLKPPEFVPDDAKAFSSILRIASHRVQIWTHFDLYDNVLVQVSGMRRVILFAPEDSQFLYLRDDKSQVNNLDNIDECLERYPLIRHANWHFANLNSSDCLYIPSCWWHNIRSLGSDGVHNISFNIFWKEACAEKFYSPSDIYGNAYLSPADSAIGSLDKAVGQLKRLPHKYKVIYAEILCQRMKRKLGV